MKTSSVLLALALLVSLVASAVGSVAVFAWSKVRTAEIDSEGERYKGNDFLKDALSEGVALIRENT